MSYENRISLNLSSTDITAIKHTLSALEKLLKPHLKALKAHERKQLPKMADGNLPFVEKAMDYAESDPEFSLRYQRGDQLHCHHEGRASTGERQLGQPGLRGQRADVGRHGVGELYRC